MSQLVGTWEMTMVAIQRDLREGELETAFAKAIHLAFLGAVTNLSVPKETADKLKRDVLAAVPTSGEVA